MKLPVKRTKMDVANWSQSRIDMSEESRTRRYMYSLRLAMLVTLRLAMLVTQEKHPNAMAIPTNPVARMLVAQSNTHIMAALSANIN